MLIKNTRCKWFSDFNCFECKISEIENKILDANSLVITTTFKTKISEVENEIPDHAN